MNTLMKRTNGNGNANLPATSFSGMVDRIFQDNLGRFFDDGFWGFNGLNQKVTVPVNLRETEKSYELDLVAPGLKKEDFKVHLNGHTLTVLFEQQAQQTEENKGQGWLRNEYTLGSFSRSFQLDDSIDTSKITAEYRDGILHLQLMKKEEARSISRNIEIG